MKKIYNRIGYFSLGIILIALGIVLGSKAELGMAPFDSFALNLSIISGFTFGTVCLVFVFVFFFLQIALLRKKFDYKSSLSVVLAGFLSITIDILMYQVFYSDFGFNLWLSSLVLLVGISCLALGISFVYIANFYPLPFESFVLVVHRLYHWPISRVKMAVDGVFLICSFILVLVFKLSPTNIGLGTIAYLLLVGPLIGIFNKLLIKVFKIDIDL